MTLQKIQKKQTIDGIAYENVRVTLPKTSNSAKAELSQARKAFKLAKSDSRKIIKDARRQRRQARLAYKAAKLTMRAQKLSK